MILVILEVLAVQQKLKVGICFLYLWCGWVEDSDDPTF